MNSKAWVVIASMLAAGTAQAACYTVYKADGSMLHESSTPPVNLALPIGDTVTEKFGPGASMAVSEHDFFCRDRRADAKGAQAQQTAQKSLARALQMDEEKTAAMVIKGSPEAVQAASKAAK